MSPHQATPDPASSHISILFSPQSGNLVYVESINHLYECTKLLTDRDRFYNFHGQPNARLNRDESIYGGNIYRDRSLTFLLCSPFLFWMPDIYLAELEKIWLDDTVNYIPWNRFMRGIIRDWNESATPVRRSSLS